MFGRTSVMSSSISRICMSWHPIENAAAPIELRRAAARVERDLHRRRISFVEPVDEKIIPARGEQLRAQAAELREQTIAADRDVDRTEAIVVIPAGVHPKRMGGLARLAHLRDRLLPPLALLRDGGDELRDVPGPFSCEL